MTNEILEQFLNKKENLNLEDVLLLKNKFFVYDKNKIVKIKQIEPTIKLDFVRKYLKYV